MKFKLRGNRVLLDKPAKPEPKTDLILNEDVEKEQEKEMMKKWTHLNVFAVGEDVKDITIGDKVYVRTQALHSAEIIEFGEDIKMSVKDFDIAIVWEQ